MPNPVAIGETAPQTALPAQVDIYDFDKTLVPFDSGSLFIGYCALHYPWVLVYLPVWFIACLLFALRVLSLQKFKNLCFGFLPMVPVQRAAKGFWEKHLHLPYLLCTRHNPKTGRILGQNCRGEEKVRRFHRAFPGVQVVDVYSDSLGHDKPIFGLATGTCYHVTGHAPRAFNYRTQYKD